MPRWIAIGKAPGWDDIKKFGAELKETPQWRIDAKTTVTSVTALADGRMIAECHGGAQSDFDEWFKKKGWTIESITPIRHVAKAGDIWKVD